MTADAFLRLEDIFCKEVTILTEDTHSFWVFVMQLGSCDLFEAAWIPAEKQTS